MTALKLSPNASGAGSFTIAAPSTSSTLTLNLPSTLGTNNGSALVSTDASGNLGLGVTPVVKAQISQTNTNVVGNGSTYLGLGALENGVNGKRLIGFGYKSTNYYPAYLGYVETQNAGSTWGDLVFYTRNTTNDVEPSERARIDSSGNLLVGTTSASDTADSGIKLKNNSGDPYLVNVRSGSTNSFTTYAAYSTGAGAYRFYVGMGGTIYATSTSISAISDATLKENVRDLETGLPEVMALRPRRFDWKNGDAQNVAGFVAQEVEQVLPELVTDYVYNKDEDGNDIIKKSLKMGDILPTLVKAIQEQQTLIQDQLAIINTQQTELEQLKAQLTSVSEDVAALKGAK